MASGNNYISAQRNSPSTPQLEELQLSKFIVDRAADAIFWVDPDAQFLYVNDVACRIARYSREELLSMSMYDVDPNFSTEVWLEHWETIKQQGSIYFESLHQNWKGWSFPVEVTVTYCSYNGREYGCIFVRDITKHKQAEEALRRANEALSRVQEHTSNLRAANDQLRQEIAERRQAELEIRQALEQEKELGELRARFVSMVSHEFRNPLHVISFSTSFLRRHSHQWTEEIKLKYLHRIQTAVEYLSHLMAEVLLIGRAEAGKLTLEPRTLDLEQFCCDLVAQLQVGDTNKHNFNFRSLSNCSTACVDEKLLQPILTNLLSNASKYSSTNSTIELALSCQDTEVIFQVKDQGIGISAADQQRLFEPFHRGENVEDIPGTGLGLAIVKKLVDIHGGQINVESEVGVGTTFTVTLPFVQIVEARAS